MTKEDFSYLSFIKNVLKKILPYKVYEVLLSTYHTLLEVTGLRSNPNTSDYWNTVWSHEDPDSGSRDDSDLHDHIIALIPEGSKVIDLGCGNGILIKKIKSIKGANCVALDFSTEALIRIKQEGFQTICASLPDVPCDENTFDCVICSEVLEHLDNPNLTIKQMHRLVKENGLIIFSVPDGTFWRKGGEHVQEFSSTNCIGLLRHYVNSVHLIAMINSAGYPHLICWGNKVAKSRFQDLINKSGYFSNFT